MTGLAGWFWNSAHTEGGGPLDHLDLLGCELHTYSLSVALDSVFYYRVHLHLDGVFHLSKSD